MPPPRRILPLFLLLSYAVQPKGTSRLWLAPVSGMMDVVWAGPGNQAQGAGHASYKVRGGKQKVVPGELLDGDLQKVFANWLGLHLQGVPLQI